MVCRVDPKYIILLTTLYVCRIEEASAVGADNMGRESFIDFWVIRMKK